MHLNTKMVSLTLVAMACGIMPGLAIPQIRAPLTISLAIFDPQRYFSGNLGPPAGVLEEIGDKCDSNQNCAANQRLYCSKSTKRCKERVGPGKACEQNEACFRGVCYNGTCREGKITDDCNVDSDCEKGLVCGPLEGPNGLIFSCTANINNGYAGSRCAYDSNCANSFFCREVQSRGYFCVIDRSCSQSGVSCLISKRCCSHSCTSHGLERSCD